MMFTPDFLILYSTEVNFCRFETKFFVHFGKGKATEN